MTLFHAGTVPGRGWKASDFRKKLQVRVVRCEDMEMEFDLVGADASLANAFRRVIIEEVPTMAIEKVHMINNTSIIQVITILN